MAQELLSLGRQVTITKIVIDLPGPPTRVMDYRGRTGSIDCHAPGDVYPYRVAFDDGCHFWFKADEIIEAT